MRRMAAPVLLSLACALASAGCRWSYSGSDSGSIKAGAGGVGVGAEGADGLIPALNSFTEELASKVEKAGDAKAGLAEAQTLLDSRKTELAGRVSALRASPQLKSDASARGRLLEAEVDDTERVHRLQVTYSDAATRDPDFKARLDKLVSDYDSIFK